MIKSNSNFLDYIITGDKSWCFAYDPETKHQRMVRSKHTPLQKISISKIKSKDDVDFVF